MKQNEAKIQDCTQNSYAFDKSPDTFKITRFAQTDFKLTATAALPRLWNFG
ncbi:MAG: hypothetical protein ACPH2K_06430 [Flavicella sp.]